MNNNLPNIVVCLTDQLRPFELGCYGHPVVETPHIDALASRGIRFETAVTNNPVCTPARSCLLSGQYSRTCTGLLSNENDEAPGFDRPRFPAPTIADVLKDNGYLTALVGKWHVAGHPTQMGFDRAVFPRFHHLNRHQMFFDESGRGFSVPGLAEDFNHTTFDAVVNEAFADDRPFFAFYNIATPHMPFFDVPDEFQSMYSREQVRLRDNVRIDGVDAKDAEWFGDTTWFEVYMWDFLKYAQNLPFVLPEGFDIRDLTARYYGMVSYTDHHVGLLMKQLREHGVDENTIVVFASDHGDMLGSHHRYNKGTLYEEAIRIPLIVNAPGKLQPRTITSQIASLIDIMPTVLGMADIDCPETVQGQDLGRVLSGDRRVLERNHVFIETAGWQIGVRTIDELYGMQLTGTNRARTDHDGIRCSKQDESVEASDSVHFECTEDPFELENLADRSAGGELEEALMTWHRETPWLFDSASAPEDTTV